MEKISRTFILVTWMFSSTCFADNLILSTNLKVEYPAPLLISHGSSDLIVKYKNWTFEHVVIDPKNIFQQIDLTGLERDYFKSVFDKKERSKLPEWLAVVAKEQADVLGVNPDSIKRFHVGKAEIFTVHDKKNTGRVYVFDELAIHQFTVLGSNKELEIISNGIKER